MPCRSNGTINIRTGRHIHTVILKKRRGHPNHQEYLISQDTSTLKKFIRYIKRTMCSIFSPPHQGLISIHKNGDVICHPLCCFLGPFRYGLCTLWGSNREKKWSAPGQSFPEKTSKSMFSGLT